MPAPNLNQPCVLIVANNYHHSLVTFFVSRGFQVLDCKLKSEAELIALPELKRVCGIITDTRLIIRETLLKHIPKLRWIGRLGSGLEHIDLQALQARGIVCVSTPEGNALAVAEHCLGLYLALLRGIVRANSEVQEKVWKRNENRGTELANCKVGIIGYGNTGKAFARLLACLGVEVLVYDKYKIIEQDIDEAGIIPATLKQIFAQVDTVSLHLPLTEETRYYADTEFFQRFHKSIFFINSSRGQIVDTDSLISAYEQGIFRGVALDVLENEKLSKWGTKENEQFAQLQAMPNFILTPHIAGYTFQSLEKMSYLLCQKLKALTLV